MTKKTKFFIALILIILSVNTYAQECLSLTLPKSNDVGNGGALCLEGSPSIDNKICIKNENGNLNYYFNKFSHNSANPPFPKFKFGINDDTEENSEFAITGLNNTNTNRFFPDYYSDISFDFAWAGSAKIRGFRGLSHDTYLQFLTTKNNAGSDDPKVRMQINHDGKVLIGDVGANGFTTPNNYKLYVNGGILTTKVVVGLIGGSSWADYVFDEKYRLMPLEELDIYIKKNKHLPNIPTANDLVKKGLDLSEMQTKQMEKIEELTLYLIQVKKELNELKKEMKELKKENHEN